MFVSRRRLLVDLGRASIGAVVLGTAAAACGSDRDDADDNAAGARDRGNGWARVDLGFVSAYVVIRGGEAAVIDTGVAGSAGAIEETLTDLGAGWSDVGHVLLTHKHPDHVGSVETVLEAAAAATAYAGAEDIPAISAPRDLTAVGDGDQVMGLEIVATPGHTPGHVSVLDPDEGVLFAGDALNGEGGAVVGPNPDFSEDLDAAWASVVKLGQLRFDTVVFGHGAPATGDASQQVASLDRP